MAAKVVFFWPGLRQSYDGPGKFEVFWHQSFIGFKDSEAYVQAQVKWAAANTLSFAWKHKVTASQLGQKKQEKELKELIPLAIAAADKGTVEKDPKGMPAANSFKEMYDEDRFVFDLNFWIFSYLACQIKRIWCCEVSLVKWLQTNNRHELRQEHCLTSLAQFKMYEAGGSAFWVEMEPEADMPCTFDTANDYANLWLNKTGGKHMCPVLIVVGVKSADETKKQKTWKCVAGYGALDH